MRRCLLSAHARHGVDVLQTTRDMGAVGGIRNVKAAARAAQLVKDHTHHSILVGDQATDFAVQMGLPYSSLTTRDSAELHREWEGRGCQPNFYKDVRPGETSGCGPYAPINASTAHHPLTGAQCEDVAGLAWLLCMQAFSWPSGLLTSCCIAWKRICAPVQAVL